MSIKEVRTDLALRVRADQNSGIAERKLGLTSVYSLETITARTVFITR